MNIPRNSYLTSLFLRCLEGLQSPEVINPSQLAWQFNWVMIMAGSWLICQNCRARRTRVTSRGYLKKVTRESIIFLEVTGMDNEGLTNITCSGCTVFVPTQPSGKA